MTVVLCLVPVVVAVSRLYRGMHFLTDVSAGALAGGLWMVIVMVTLLRSAGRHAGPAPRAVAAADRPR